MKNKFLLMVSFFRWEFLLTPLSTVNTNIVYARDEGGGNAGFTTVYIFGFRVARFQITHPWE